MIIAIDSSINNVGYAMGENGKILASGVIRSKGEGWSRLYELAEGLKREIGRKDLPIVRTAIVEIPGTFAYARSADNAGKGLNQAAMQKLNIACGALILTLQCWGAEVETIQAHEWKGSGKTARPKKLDQMLAAQHIGRKCGNDEADAVMLCVWRMIQ